MRWSCSQKVPSISGSDFCKSWLTVAHLFLQNLYLFFFFFCSKRRFPETHTLKCMCLAAVEQPSSYQESAATPHCCRTEKQQWAPCLSALRSAVLEHNEQGNAVVVLQGLITAECPYAFTFSWYSTCLWIFPHQFTLLLPYNLRHYMYASKWRFLSSWKLIMTRGVLNA